MSTIAEKLMKEYKLDRKKAMALADEMSIDIDQDWEFEETCYSFKDGSTLTIDSFNKATTE